MNLARVILTSAILAAVAHASDSVDFVVAQQKRESEEKIAQLQRENDVKTSIIYSIGIVGAGACIAYGVFRGLSVSRKNA
jgi:hypothetical protein